MNKVFYLCRFSLIVLFLSSNFVVLKAQNSYSAIVLDAATREALPYVNIGIPARQKGTVTNEGGYFILSDCSPQDNIIVSYISYETVVLTGRELSEKDSIFLSPIAYTLGTPIITDSKLSKEVTLGVYNENRGHSIGFGNRQLGTEVGAPIYIDKPTYIKSAHFVLNHAKGDSLLFRINIYDYTDNKVGEKLILDNIYYKDKQKKGTFSIDLEAYNLVVDHNIMLALEWLKDFDATGNEGITFDTKKGRKLKGVYLKNSSNAAFEKLGIGKPLNPCFYLKGMQ